MSNNFGLKIGVEGEKAFKQSLSDINQAFKVLGSEMQLVTSQFDKNDTSVQALAARNSVLNKEIDTQKQKIDTLKSALANASESFGENDRRTQNWQIQLNKAQAALNNMERDLKASGGALQDNTKQTEDNRSALQKLVDYSKTGDSSIQRLGTSVKGTGTAFKEVGGAVKDSASTLKDNVKEFASDTIDKGKQKWGNFKDTVNALKNPLNLAGAGLEALSGKLTGTTKSAKADEQAVEGLGDEMKGTAKDADKLSKDTGALGTEMDGTGKKASTFGDMLKASLASAAIQKGLSVIVDGIKSVSSAVGNLVMQGGFDRAMNIEQASFKLQGLGHDADSVDAIMKNSLNSVKGTAFGLGDAATVAAGAVAAGIKPGKDLEKTLKLVGDTAAISGRGMDEMGAIFNKIAASGKMSSTEMNQLMQSGIPVMQLLSETMGVSTEEVKTLVKEGKIGMPEFQAAIEKGMGGAALAVGQTFSGSVDNAKAAFSRLGAGIITPLTQSLTPALGLITGLVDDITSGSTENVQGTIKKLSGAIQGTIKDLLNNIKPILTGAMDVISQLIPAISGMLPELLPVAVDILSTLLGGIIDNLPIVVGAAADILFALFEALISGLPTLLDAAAKILTTLIQGLTDSLPKLIPVAVDAIISIAKGLLENLQPLLDAALELIKVLADGLISAIPSLLEQLPEIIQALVDFLIEAIPQIIEAGKNLLLSIIEALPEIIEGLVSMIPQIIDGLLTAILEAIPLLIEAGIALLTALVEALPDIIAAIVEAIPKILDGIVTALKENIPLIIDAGIKLLTALVEALPEIIDAIVTAIPTIIDSVITAIIDAIPLLIDAGVKLLISLVENLPKIITTLVNAIPKIITSLIDAIIGNIDKIIMAGVQLLVALVENTPKIIVELVKAIPKIIQGILDAIVKFVPKMAEMGLNLIQGIWNGISDAAAWLWEKVSGFFGDLWDNICGWFGIASPSKKMKGIGKYMSQGLGIGFVDEMNKQSQDMIDSIPTELPTPGMGDMDINRTIHTAFDNAGAAVTLSDIGFKLDGIAGIMLQMFPQLLEALDINIVLDDGTLVGKLAPAIDRSLGIYQRRNLGVV